MFTGVNSRHGIGDFCTVVCVWMKILCVYILNVNWYDRYLVFFWSHLYTPTFVQWRKKMFLNRGAVDKIACKARKNFFGSHDIWL